MKKSTRYFIALTLLLSGWSAQPLRACDVCGCSMGSNYFGILPQFDQHFIGIRWHYSRFQARMNHNSALLADEYSQDTYQQVEVWGRFYLTPRLQAFVSLPYSYNVMDGSHQDVIASGLGDASLLINYALLNTGEEVGEPWRHTLLAGAGVKLPTGDFRQEDSGLLVNPNFQLGTGSTDFVLNAMYTVRYQNVGVNLTATRKFNTENAEAYRFGNQWNASGQLFYWRKIENWSVLPNGGLYYEAGDFHTDAGFRQPNTGGEIWFGQLGLDVYYKNVVGGVTYKNPIRQRMNSDAIADIEAQGRWVLSLIYTF